MPYKVKGKCIFKKDGGVKVGCTKGDVNKYLAALHANANESVNEGVSEEHYLSLPKAICTIEPMGENGLEGYVKGVEYRYEFLKTKLGKDYYRVYHDNSYYETCGPNKFKKFFKKLEPNNFNENKKPKIFTYTAYRIPNQEDLNEINSTKLSAKEILNGFTYTIVGRGVLSDKSKIDITESIKMLINIDPNNEEYKKALTMANELNPRFKAITEMKGGKADNLTVNDIADKFDVPVSQINKQLNMGKKVEKEHTDSTTIAKEIAMDHLSEFPDYYSRLAKLEKEASEHLKYIQMNESTKNLIKRLIRENLK
jgi:hypothetical protein